jgi:hypothetical protein
MIEKFKDTEGIIRSHDSEKGQTIQWEIDKGQAIICKTLYRKLNIKISSLTYKVQNQRILSIKMYKYSCKL